MKLNNAIVNVHTFQSQRIKKSFAINKINNITKLDQRQNIFRFNAIHNFTHHSSFEYFK